MFYYITDKIGAWTCLIQAPGRQLGFESYSLFLQLKLNLTAHRLPCNSIPLTRRTSCFSSTEGNAPTFPSAPGGTWPPLLQGKNGRAAGKEQLSRRTTMLGSIVEIFWMAFGHNSVPLPCLPPPTPCLFSQNTWRLFFKSDLFYRLRIGLCLGGRREAISLWDLLMIHSVDTPWIPG